MEAFDIMNGSRPWNERLKFIVDVMREMSRQTDPQLMVKTYVARMRNVMPSDGFISLSRRDLPAPHYRITRSSLWNEDINPWKNPDILPTFEHGLLGRLIYGDEPVIIDDLEALEGLESDPAAQYFHGHRSLIAMPLFDGGQALNMVVMLSRNPGAFPREQLPERVWMSNLFGRATQNLVLSEQVRSAYETVDRELRAVADIQRSLLPSRLPDIPTLQWAAHYQTSRRAGGDYYDFFPLPDGQWGVLMADVSGHGTPAAVLMAITHSIAHTGGDPKMPPSRLMRFVNERLCHAYTMDSGNFVTAWYAVYEPRAHRLTYCNAGHPAPRLRDATDHIVRPLQSVPSLPLGIDADETYADDTVILRPRDSVILYTDGITEARSRGRELLGTERLDDVLGRCDGTPEETVAEILAAVNAFTGDASPIDDQTLLVAKVS